MKRDKVLICGFGNIGKHIKNEFANYKGEIDIYDPFIEQYSYIDDDFVYDIAFVCVPTEKLDDGRCDISCVEDVVSKRNAKLFVIKSTIPVGTSQYLKDKYSNDDKSIVFSPEYYGTTIHSPISPNFLILGGDREDCDKVADLYHEIKDCDFTIRFTTYETAELAKYMENCFLGLKVTFCAEFFEVAKRLGISYNDLREIFVSDERMGKSHTYINPEQPYYNSHCLNKDIPAFITQICNENEGLLMKAVNQININKKRGGL